MFILNMLFSTVWLYSGQLWKSCDDSLTSWYRRPVSMFNTSDTSGTWGCKGITTLAPLRASWTRRGGRELPREPCDQLSVPSASSSLTYSVSTASDVGPRPGRQGRTSAIRTMDSSGQHWKNEEELLPTGCSARTRTTPTTRHLIICCHPDDDGFPYKRLIPLKVSLSECDLNLHLDH